MPPFFDLNYEMNGYIKYNHYKVTVVRTRQVTQGKTLTMLLNNKHQYWND